MLLHSCTRAGSTLVLAHNMAAQPASVTAKVASPEDPEETFGGAILLDLLDGENVALADDGGFELELERYGYRWFRIQRDPDLTPHSPAIYPDGIRRGCGLLSAVKQRGRGKLTRPLPA